MKAAADIIPSPIKHNKLIQKHAFAVDIWLIACKKLIKQQYAYRSPPFLIA